MIYFNYPWWAFMTSARQQINNYGLSKKVTAFSWKWIPAFIFTDNSFGMLDIYRCAINFGSIIFVIDLHLKTNIQIKLSNQCYWHVNCFDLLFAADGLLCYRWIFKHNITQTKPLNWRKNKWHCNSWHLKYY